MSSNNTRRKLENHLTLHGWLNSHFGYKTTRDLLNAVKDEEEGFSPDGHSPICQFLISRVSPDSEIAEALPTYDENIKRHLSTINNRRTQQIVLRYFQYLSLLYTEIFLDWKFNKHAKFISTLNNFVQTQNMAKAPGDVQDSGFTQTDIEKLAFWMATGAGKTLLMHINYHQFLHYCLEPLDHIVLITPNEGLSEQHIRELHSSDIRCERFNVEGHLLTQISNTVQVIEITKLVEEKTGGGVSVPVEAFEGNNLILLMKDIRVVVVKCGVNTVRNLRKPDSPLNIVRHLDRHLLLQAMRILLMSTGKPSYLTTPTDIFTKMDTVRISASLTSSMTTQPKRRYSF